MLENISYKIASWALILVGIGHTITDLVGPKTKLQNDFIIKMKAFPIEIAGSKTNIYSFHQGFSIMMGLLLLSYGIINLLIIKNNQTQSLQTNFIVLNIITCFITVILSIKYFFIVPIIFTSIAFVGFTISLIIKLKK